MLKFFRWGDYPRLPVWSVNAITYLYRRHADDKYTEEKDLWKQRQIGVKGPQAKEWLQPPETGRSKNFPLGASRGNAAPLALSAQWCWFWTSALHNYKKINLGWLSHLVVVIGCSRQRNLKQIYTDKFSHNHFNVESLMLSQKSWKGIVNELTSKNSTVKES